MPPGERGTEGEKRSDHADAAFAGSQRPSAGKAE